jgi:chloride channel protein, CIC family
LPPIVPAPPSPSSPTAPPGPSAAPRVFHRSFLGFLRSLPGSNQRFWLLVAATGVAGGLGAVLLVHLLRGVQSLVWSHGAGNLEGADAASPPLLRLLVPIAGGVLVTVTALILRRPLGGHGTSGVIEAIWVRYGHLRLSNALVRGTVSIIAVGMGASLGREGALIQGGAATGSYLGERWKLPTDQGRLLVAAGAAAGIAAAYNMPIGASLFGLEVFLGSFALELFGPIVIACVIAVFISRILITEHPTYEIPAYVLGSAPRELIVALAIGLLVGVASALFVRVVDLSAAAVARLPKQLNFFLPPVAMAVLGVVALWYPQVLGNGYTAVNAELLVGLPLGLLLVLPVLKLAMTALCAAFGVPGGMFTPSLFYGAFLGGAIGALAQRIMPGAGSPQAYALVGMCAALAGTTHATVSATVMIFEMTGNYGVVLPLLLASVASTTVSRRLCKESLYTAPLRRRNVALPEMPRPGWLGAAPTRDLVDPDVPRIEPEARFPEVLRRLLELGPGQPLFVCRADGHYVGVIVLEAIRGFIRDESLLDVVVADDIVDRGVAPVAQSGTLPAVALRFSETTMDRLPVVDENGHFVGAVSRSDVLRRGPF